jgi:CubicO group peptidase (beta-lactamase class C family)
MFKRLLVSISVVLFLVQGSALAASKNHHRHKTHRSSTSSSSSKVKLPSPNIKVSRNPMPITGTVEPVMSSFENQFINLLRQWQIPGGTVAIVKNDRVVYAKGFGWANKETRTPAEPDSLFRIASVSKLFTAVTVLKLAQEGKLNLEDPVFSILNDLPPMDGRAINPRIYEIKVKNLLQMSSGWFSPGGHWDPMFGPWSKQMVDRLQGQVPASCESTVRVMMTMPLRSKPGSNFVYSNLDYCLLGLVINKASGHPYGYQGYEDHVTQQVLAPVGINNMFIGDTLPTARMPNEATYYSDSAPNSEDEFLNYLPYSEQQILKKNFSDGGWVATSTDLARFMYALSHGQILNQTYLQIMQSKPDYLSHSDKGDYFSMGMKVYNLGSGQTYWIQTGSFTGTNAMVVNRPDGTTIAVTFNNRPGGYSFFTRFRPELRAMLMSSQLTRAIGSLPN